MGEDGFEPPKVKTSRFTVCPIWPLWYSPVFSFLFGDFFVGLRIVGRSLPPGNSLPPRSSASKSLKNKLRNRCYIFGDSSLDSKSLKNKLRKILLKNFEPMEGVEPTTPRLQITCSSQLSYIGISVSVPLNVSRNGLQR